MRKITLHEKWNNLLLWLTAGGLVLAALPEIHDDEVLCLAAGAVLVAALCMTRFKLGYNYVSAPIIYLGILGVFHLGLVVPWALGLYDPRDFWWFFRMELQPAMFMVTLAIVFCQAGIILATPRQRKIDRLVQDGPPVQIEDDYLFKVSLAFAGVGLVMYVAAFIRLFGWNVTHIVYTDIFQLIMEKDSRWFGISVWMLPVGFYTAAAAASRKRLRFIVLALGIAVVWELFLGSRSSGLIPPLVIFYLCVRKRFTISRRVVVALGILFLYAIPILAVTRQVKVTERLQVGSTQEANPLNGFAEMGATIWVVGETIHLIGPDEYRQGGTYIEALRRVIPNLSGQYQPGQQLRLWNLYNTPSLWFITVTDPSLLRTNQGFGFSSIAEAYMNFGPWGVVVTFLLTGCLLAQLESLKTPNAYYLAGRAILLSPLIWTVRNDFTVMTRTVIWGWLFLFLVWGVRVLLKGRKPKPVVKPPLPAPVPSKVVAT